MDKHPVAQAGSARSWEDVDPSTNWLRQEEMDTLVLDLPEGFKKKHVKVVIDHYGNLRISGECREEEENQGRRFSKSFRVPQECITNEIRAKMIEGKVHVKMPKKNSSRSVGVTGAENNKINVGATLGSQIRRLSGRKKLAVGLAAVSITAILALGIYAAYRRMLNSSVDDN